MATNKADAIDRLMHSGRVTSPIVMPVLQGKREIIPLNDRVLIEPIQEDNFSKGGVLIAGGDGATCHAIVLAVGEGKAMPSGRMPIACKVGDKVIYGELNNTVEDKLNGKDVLLVVEQAIVAIIKD